MNKNQPTLFIDSLGTPSGLALNPEAVDPDTALGRAYRRAAGEIIKGVEVPKATYGNQGRSPAAAKVMRTADQEYWKNK